MLFIGRMSKLKTCRIGCMIWGLGLPVKKICIQEQLFQAAEATVSVELFFYLSSDMNVRVDTMDSNIGTVHTTSFRHYFSYCKQLASIPQAECGWECFS